MYTHPCRLIPSGKMKEQLNLFWCCTDLLFFCLFTLHISLCLSLPDPGVFFRVLGWHQACMLDEGRKPLEVFPQAVHLPKGHEHKPVLPHHHPASGTRRNISTKTELHSFSTILEVLRHTNTYWSSFFCRLAAVHPANHRRGRHVGLLPFRSVFVG